MKTIQIPCTGYSVTADIYEGSNDSPLLLSLIGRTSRRNKKHYQDFFPMLEKQLGVTSVIFDYTGHGDSPFVLEELAPAQHFLEVITVFDWMKAEYPNRKIFVIGSSYGGFHATQLTKYREFDGLILRAPAIYRPGDFYTKEKDEDEEATGRYRRDSEELSKNPLLARAAQFKGKVLLVVHERDERIPKETTDAFANAFQPEVILARGLTHSLSAATPEQAAEYDQKIIDWIKANS